MQMRTGDAAGGAHLADEFTRLHHIAFAHRDGAQVAHHAEQAAAMVEPDGGAVEKIVARVDDPSGHGRADWGAARRSDVHAAVRIARLAVEHPAQPERAGAAPFGGHLHAQVEGVVQGLAEGGSDLLGALALALVARQVFW